MEFFKEVTDSVEVDLLSWEDCNQMIDAGMIIDLINSHNT